VCCYDNLFVCSFDGGFFYFNFQITEFVSALGARKRAVKVPVNIITFAGAKGFEGALLEGIETFRTGGGHGAAGDVGDGTVVADQVGAVGQGQAAAAAAGVLGGGGLDLNKSGEDQGCEDGKESGAHVCGYVACYCLWAWRRRRGVFDLENRKLKGVFYTIAQWAMALESGVKKELDSLSCYRGQK
jgi:hypothetical protein